MDTFYFSTTVYLQTQEWVCPLEGSKPFMDAVVLLHLTCLAVWPWALDREVHSWGWTQCQDRQMWWKAWTQPHACSLSFLFHSQSQEGGKINIYNEMLCIAETFAALFDMRTLFYREFQTNGRNWREHFTEVHHCCCISHRLLKEHESHKQRHRAELGHKVSPQSNCSKWFKFRK